jgi:hypothetical protein
MWLVLAFSALGLLIGNLVGLSTTPIVASLLGLLFAFAGGSVIAFLHKLTPPDRTAAGQALLALSVGSLIGLYAGIAVSEYRLLSPAHRRVAAPPNAGTGTTRAERAPDALFGSSGYVRNEIARKADEIDARYQNGELTAEAAFRELYRFIKAVPSDSVR